MSRRDDMIVAQGKPSAALGCGPKMITSLFPSGLPRSLSGQSGRKERAWVRWLFTQGGGLGGLTLEYLHAALRGTGKASEITLADDG